MKEIAVSFERVSKVYRTYAAPIDRLKEILFRGRRVFHNTITALDNVSFEIEKGTTFGIVGRNGSGKSTALQLIASVLQPTAGSVTINGRVSALLELGSGFNGDFSGLDNVYLYASILGLTREQVDAKLESILAFAEIGDFIHQPVKTYSSGMVVRLAFSVAVAIEPDILIVDEALSVGDALFQHKCILKMREIISSGATVIFVSHDIATVKLLCSRAILLERGKLVALGSAEEVARDYHRRLFAEDLETNERPLGSEFVLSGTSTEEKKEGIVVQLPQGAGPTEEQRNNFAAQASKTRFGTGEAEIIYVEVLSQSGERTSVIEYAEYFTVRLYIQFKEFTSSAVAGVVIRNGSGVDVIATNTHIERTSLLNCQSGETVMIDFRLKNILRDDVYSINPAVTHEQYFHQARPYDWIDNAVVIRAARPRSTVVYGLFYPTDLSVAVQREHEVESKAANGNVG